MGIHINGDHNSVNVVHGDAFYGDVNYGPPPKPPIGFFGLMFSVMVLIWLIVKFWWIVLIVVSVGAIVFTTWLERKEKRQAALEALRQEGLLAARAERQNSAYLRGEPWGMYGSFPPPEVPNERS
jgi:uncharacterized membrane protein